MAGNADHTRDSLPSQSDLFWQALKWTMRRKGGYTGYDLKPYLAIHFKLTEEQLDQTRTDGTNRFDNLVDWITAEFTSKGAHTGWNGEEHKSPDQPYFLTKYGYSVGERKVEKPTEKRHGAKNAMPDIRQLTAEQEGLAPWLSMS